MGSLEEDVMKRIGKIDDLEKYYSSKVASFGAMEEKTGTDSEVNGRVSSRFTP